MGCSVMGLLSVFGGKAGSVRLQLVSSSMPGRSVAQFPSWHSSEKSNLAACARV